MAFGFQRKSLDDILAGAPGQAGRGYDQETSGTSLRPRVAKIGLGRQTGALPGGTTYQGFVFSNPRVVQNLRRLEEMLLEQDTDPTQFSFRVSGGDRYVDSEGNHRSATDHQIVPNSDPNSPHLVENGARAADIVVTGVSHAAFEQALRQTEFLPANTRYYPDHIHVALPNLREYYAPN